MPWLSRRTTSTREGSVVEEREGDRVAKFAHQHRRTEAGAARRKSGYLGAAPTISSRRAGRSEQDDLGVCITSSIIPELAGVGDERERRCFFFLQQGSVANCNKALVAECFATRLLLQSRERLIDRSDVILRARHSRNKAPVALRRSHDQPASDPADLLKRSTDRRVARLTFHCALFHITMLLTALLCFG